MTTAANGDLNCRLFDEILGCLGKLEGTFIVELLRWGFAGVRNESLESLENKIEEGSAWWDEDWGGWLSNWFCLWKLLVFLTTLVSYF